MAWAKRKPPRVNSRRPRHGVSVTVASSQTNQKSIKSSEHLSCLANGGRPRASESNIYDASLRPRPGSSRKIGLKDVKRSDDPTTSIFRKIENLDASECRFVVVIG